jgi:hypothetical protein
MSNQANVYSSASNQVWYTDKAAISTGASTVTYQVNLAPDFGNTIYSNPVQVPANSRQEVFVGVGNQLTVVGSCTIQEIGTASSGTAGVNAV